MTDIIRLLPDVVANQIAAGEVIQRPASAVKELMENSLDAGATQIQLIIKDAGKTLIQVVDNGVGMSETDARMAFERHATSKIQRAEDLFAIKTMGFRGEAMASVGAVAQVELKTRKHESETGTHLIIEGSKFLSQEPCATQPGTTIMVKNLFFNIPARKNFLKSNASETRHIVEEFQRLAIARPEIGFAMFHDGFEVYRLHPGNLKQRIMGIYGNNYNERMVPVQESTTILNLGGFVLKPEFARKTRGEQYFFVNNRFIKNGYLNHAVADAFEQLLPNGTFPSYFIMIDIDPAKIDINIHPTKTEIKFDDEKSVYAIIRAAVKRSLGKFSITPSLDFEQETAFNIPVHMYQSTPKLPGIKINPGYNPFREETVEKTSQSDFRWGQVSRPAENEMLLSGMLPLPVEPVQEEVCQVVCQYNRQYIVALYRNTFVFIDQQAAHERVLFEKNKKLLEQSPSAIQQELFPQTLTFSPDDFLIIRELLSDIGKLGFDLREFGANTIVLNGVPAGVEKGKEKEVIDHILESFKNSNHQFRNNQKENLLISVSRNLAIKSGQELSSREMQHLANELFKCDQPGFDATGSPTFVSLDSQEIEKKFQQRTR